MGWQKGAERWAGSPDPRYMRSCPPVPHSQENSQVLQLSAHRATAFYSDGTCLCSDTEVQVRAHTWHLTNTWHLWIALQSCRKADHIFLSPNSSQKLKHRERKYGQYNLVLKNTTAAEKLVKPILLSSLSLRCWINILLLTSIHSVY